MEDPVRSIHLLFPESDRIAISNRLRFILDPEIRITSGDETPKEDSCLFLAPHEFDLSTQVRHLRSTSWKWVHLSTAGYDFFPLEEVPIGTWVTRSWKAYAEPLAEYVLRAVLRHAHSNLGTGVRGQRIGVVGYGEVGRLVTELLHKLGAKVTVLRKSGGPVEFGEVTRSKWDLLDMTQLVLTLPLNRESENILGREFLARCSSGMHLVNVSRGELIDQEALLDFTRSKELWATLDVTVPEPLPPRHPLRFQERILISEHVAWNSGSDPYGAILEDFTRIWECLKVEIDPPGCLRKGEFRHQVSGA